MNVVGIDDSYYQVEPWQVWRLKQEVKKVQTDNGEKKVVKIKMELAEDHLSVRAAQFKDIVKKNSDRFDVDQPLIYAVIEQESAFNPKAKSHAPAYGLMQLVPKSGGRDAFRHVHKRDVVPAPAYLYVPENNVELGTGYLNLLMTQTFAQVKDPQCRMLCAIAAYNTGAGNVSRAINGGRSVSKAVPAINAMSYDKEAISRSNCAHQTPGHLNCSDLGRAQDAGPT